MKNIRCSYRSVLFLSSSIPDLSLDLSVVLQLNNSCTELYPNGGSNCVTFLIDWARFAEPLHQVGFSYTGIPSQDDFIIESVLLNM